MNLDVTIATDKNGNHVVVFPGHRDELLPPEEHYAKMNWIRASFKSFLRRVRERELLTRAYS